jgi:transglutaminase-like putative cysteine protease
VSTEFTPPRERPEWHLSIAVFLAIGVSTASLGGLLADAAWWFAVMGAVLIVNLAMVGTRFALKGRGWPVLAGSLALVATLCLFFAPTASILGFIPTFDTIAAFDELSAAGARSIQSQGTPAVVVPGILFILVAALGFIAIALDLIAIVARSPAITGLLLLTIVMVPTLVDPDASDAFFFILTGAAWLAIVHLSAPYVQTRAAFGLGAASLAAALIVQLVVLPAIPENDRDSFTSNYAIGINPILTLGDNLRGSTPQPALRYTTDIPLHEYFTFSVLDSFDDEGWQPSTLEQAESNNLSAIGPVPGRSEDIVSQKVTTNVRIGEITGRWIPTPYAPESVKGLEGNWAWQPDTLGIRSTSSSMRNQEYTVVSNVGQPSVRQLRAAGIRVDPDLERYVELPENLPDSIRETALEVVGDAENNFDKARAMQSWFRGSQFTYSETAPVEEGFDGNDAAIIARFLDVKSGYCVHYSSAMAVMARSLGMPARVSVGFTPGTLTNSDGGQSYLVTTKNLHAWPEIYFDEIGWVRFEPTPGQGNVPLFEGNAIDPTFEPSAPPSIDPTTPDPVEPSVDPSDPSSAAPTPTPGSSTGPIGALDPKNGSTVPIVLAIIGGLALILFIPAIVRSVRRSRRFSAVKRRGSADAAWAEIADTALDLQLPVDEAVTPRELARLINGPDALWRLREAFESGVFGDQPVRVTVADLSAALAAMRAEAPTSLRLRARFAPASVLQRWISRTRAD